jgi:hypothetical protein
MEVINLVPNFVNRSAELIGNGKNLKFGEPNNLVFHLFEGKYRMDLSRSKVKAILYDKNKRVLDKAAITSGNIVMLTFNRRDISKRYKEVHLILEISQDGTKKQIPSNESHFIKIIPNINDNKFFDVSLSTFKSTNKEDKSSNNIKNKYPVQYISNNSLNEISKVKQMIKDIFKLKNNNHTSINISNKKEIKYLTENKSNNSQKDDIKEVVADQTNKLNILQDDMDSRGINAMNPPPPFSPAKGDGTDDSNQINTLLQNFDCVHLPSNKTFGLSKSIIIPDNKTLITLGSFATLKLLKPNIPGVQLGVNSKFAGIQILLASNNSSDFGCGINIRLDSRSTRAYIDRVEIIGNDLTGNGIYVEGNKGSVAFTQINNMYFSRTKNALKVNVNLPGYANGFIGSNWIIRSSKRAFCLIGSEGNSFTNIQWNTGSHSIEPIYCESNFNNFHGFWWDLGTSTIPNQIATFSGNAEGNLIKSSDTLPSWFINDLTSTKLNFINTMKDDVYEVIKQGSYLPNIWMSSSEYKKWGYWFDSKPFGGTQDNIFAFADKVNTVANVGKALATGTLGTAFNPFAEISSGKPTWILNEDEYIQIQIDVHDPPFLVKRLDFIQIVFSSSLEAKNVRIESSSNNGLNWVNLKNETNNANRYVVFHDTLTATKASTNPTNIRVTISNPNNENKTVRIEAIIGRMLPFPGYTFLPRNGGKIYGNLDMNNYYITLGKINSLPKPSAHYRGNLISIEGQRGVEDRIYICKKRADDTYEWVQIGI